jgi:hypothetical protein
MRPKRKKSIRQTNAILGHLAKDRKKTVMAVSLFAIMAVMWVRVLTNKKPAPVAAGPASPDSQQGSTEPALNVRLVELPNLPGRNDYINRDFFAARDWAPFRQDAHAPDSGTETEVHVVSPNHVQEVAVRIAQKLTLEAVLWNKNPHAFVNDQLLGVGDKLTVTDGTDTCEFEVLQIDEDSVLVRCNETQLTLKLTQYLDVRK